MSFFCWAINSLRSERSPLGPKVSSKCGKEMAEMLIIICQNWQELAWFKHSITEYRLYLLQSKKICVVGACLFVVGFCLFACLLWFGFFCFVWGVGLFVFQKLSVLWNSLWNNLLLKKDRFLLLGLFQPKFLMHVQIIY